MVGSVRRFRLGGSDLEFAVNVAIIPCLPRGWELQGREIRRRADVFAI
jgi:hypothetical protein